MRLTTVRRFAQNKPFTFVAPKSANQAQKFFIKNQLPAAYAAGNLRPRGKISARAHFISHDKNYTEIVRPFELHGLFARTGAQFALYLLALFGKLFLALAHLYSV